MKQFVCNLYVMKFLLHFPNEQL